MEDNRAPLPLPTTEPKSNKDGHASLVTPPQKPSDRSYEEILRQILSKKGRTVCQYCLGADVDDGTTRNGNCVFFDHEHTVKEIMAKTMEEPEDIYKDNKEQGARLACYRALSESLNGRLGRSRRKPLPACVEAQVKAMNPSASFTGYKKKDHAVSGDCNSSSDEDTWEGTMSPIRLSHKKQRNT